MNSTSRYKRNCKNCVYYKDGYCIWFEYRRMEKKLIPEDVAEKGCSHWSDDEPHPLTLVIIKKMGGKLI